MNLKTVKDTYKRYAKVYDLIFGHVMNRGRRKSVQITSFLPGERILEVGVGTGLSLPMYPHDVKVVGIDISDDMLDVARKRAQQDRLDHVEELRVMDAEAMDFPDDSFDRVIAMYVASVVPHPDRLMAEMKRVCKPGGEIIILNHFRSPHRIINGIEAVLKPISGWVGFRPDVDLDAFIAEHDLNVLDIQETDILSHWKLVRCLNAPTKEAQTTENAQPQAA